MVAAVRLLVVLIQSPGDSGHYLGIFLIVMVVSVAIVQGTTWVYAALKFAGLSKLQRLTEESYCFVGRVAPEFNDGVSAIVRARGERPMPKGLANPLVTVDKKGVTFWKGTLKPSSVFHLPTTALEGFEIGTAREFGRDLPTIIAKVKVDGDEVLLAWGVQTAGILGFRRERGRALTQVIASIDQAVGRHAASQWGPSISKTRGDR
ncbi:hypothetical protein [Diaminobutyricibacter sp. McL0608]|uniref:hypothetical protein n=1 Tax=Leifsonia sp. McL0608 TaxID=3143537 RepID=UPI0031F30B4B